MSIYIWGEGIVRITISTYKKKMPGIDFKCKLIYVLRKKWNISGQKIPNIMVSLTWPPDLSTLCQARVMFFKDKNVDKCLR
jgi:hypothetical protein